MRLFAIALSVAGVLAVLTPAGAQPLPNAVQLPKEGAYQVNKLNAKGQVISDPKKPLAEICLMPAVTPCTYQDWTGVTYNMNPVSGWGGSWGLVYTDNCSSPSSGFDPHKSTAAQLHIFGAGPSGTGTPQANVDSWVFTRDPPTGSWRGNWTRWYVANPKTSRIVEPLVELVPNPRGTCPK
jgi:hypothetical protein